MFKYIHHNDIDFSMWDECINSSENGIIYALSWYLNIVSPQWDGIVMENKKGYSAVFPVPLKKKFGVKFIKQPIFTQQLGLFSIDKEIATEYWHEILEILKERFLYIDGFAFNTSNKLPLLNNCASFQVQYITNYHLDLSKSYNKIYSGYSKDRRWRINQAKKSNIQIVRNSENIDEMIKIFDENISHKIYGIIGYSYEYKMLKGIYEEAKKRGYTNIIEAQYKNETIAMCLFYLFKNKIIYIFNSSTSSGRRLKAIPFLIDYMISQNAGSKLCFDFESPEVANVSEFYRRFGPEKALIPVISYNRLPFPVKLLKTFRSGFYKRFYKKQKTKAI